MRLLVPFFVVGLIATSYGLIQGPSSSSNSLGGFESITSDCIDTDNGHTNKYGDGCEVYVNPSAIACGGKYDDGGFIAKTMCCTCGGGRKADVSGISMEPDLEQGPGSLEAVLEQGPGPVHGWEPNKEYEFEYQGRLLTGLPALASQYSGVGMRATVKVFAKTAHNLVLQVQSPRYVDVNHLLQPNESGANNSYKKEGLNWRNLSLPPLKDVPSDFAQILVKPVEFVISADGEITQLVVSKEDNEWSINFKKALIVIFQNKVDLYSVELEQNRIVHPSDEGRTVWKVKEDSLQGRCESTYQVNELPEYLIKENPELIPLPSKCPTNPAERKYFEITRTRNLHSCERRAQFNFIKPGRINTPTKQTPSGEIVSSQNSVTRTIVCASTVQLPSMVSSAPGISKALGASYLVFQRMVSENEQNEDMMKINAEKFVTGSRQVMLLRSINDARSFPSIHHPLKIFDLMYEYDIQLLHQPMSASGNANVLTGHLSSGRLRNGAGNDNGLQKTVLSKFFPIAHLSTPCVNSCGEDLNEQIKKLLEEVTDDIIESEKSGRADEANKSNINSKLLGVAAGFSVYDKVETIKNLWEEIDRTSRNEQYRQVTRNLFVDTVAMSGNPASIEFIMDLIREDKMTRGQMFNFFMWMPQYVVYPTPSSLEIIYRTIRTQKIQNFSNLRNIATTSFSQLLQQACVSEQRKLSYPTFVNGEFCNSNSRIVKDDWIPFLLGEVASATDANERNIFLVALGGLKHKEIVAGLIPYASGALTTQAGQKVTKPNRLLAIYSLSNIGSIQPNPVITTLMTIFSNPTEATEVRIAAFNSLLRMNPSSAVIQRISSVTQQEPAMDYELLKTINIAFYTLGHKMPSAKLEGSSLEIVQKARVAFHLIRRVNGILPTSGTIYNADFLKELGVGYEAFISYVASEASMLPKSMYTEVMYVLDQVSFSPIRLGYRISGYENVYRKLGEELVKGLKISGGSGNIDVSTEGIQGDIGNNYKQMDDTKIDAALFVQLFESGSFFLSNDRLTTESLAGRIMPYLKNPELLKEALGDEMNVNIQRTFDLDQMDLLIPSDMGFPINIGYHTPTTVSIIGKITPTIDAMVPKLKISGKVLYTGQSIAYVGTVIPFCQDILFTGVNQHSVISIPGTVELEMNVPSQKLSFIVKPHPSVTTPVDMIHFHRYPFTVSQKLSDLKPLSEQPKMKQIHSPAELKTTQGEFGEYLGLKMTTKLETESRYADTASSFDILKMYKNNPFYLLMFPWTVPALSENLTPSLRKTRFSIIYDPSQSSTKEIGFEIKVGYASKKYGKSSGKYHTLKVKATSGLSNARSSATLDNWSKLVQCMSPYDVTEKIIGRSALHPRREQKLKEMLDTVEVSSTATGITLYFTGLIRGSRPTTWTSVLSILGGMTNESHGSMKQIWDIRLERPTGSPDLPKHLCTKGTLKLPILPIWNVHELHLKHIDFEFENKISMGMSSCNEASITTAGNAKVSEQQKEFSRTSLESMKCQGIVQRGELASKSSQVCKTANLQARTLDTIQLTNQFTRVPEVVKRWEQQLVVFAKSYLWPFIGQIQMNNIVVSGNTFTTSLKIEFLKWARAFDLTIKRPNENLLYTGVHIPYPFTLFAPLKAGSNNLALATQKIIPGGNLIMECYIHENAARKFDDQVVNLRYEIDGCYHILTKDALGETFSVEAKKNPGSRNYVAKVAFGQRAIILERKNGFQYANSTTINEWKPVIDMDLEVPLGHIEMKIWQEQMVELKIRKTISGIEVRILRMLFSGHDIILQVNRKYRNTLSGICGKSDTNIKGGSPNSLHTCKYTEPILEVASNRIQTGSCPQMDQSVKEKLEKEKAKCLASLNSSIQL